MFTKVLIANRGEIACRVIRTLRRMGVGSVAVYSQADANAAHVREADEAVLLGPAAAAESYLSIERVLAAAKQTGAQAIHPGYGFLSESTAFASACEAAGVRFIGPTAEQLRRFGLKHEARAFASERGVELLPGTALLADVAAASAAAERIGYPVMLKSTAGGGGIGLRVCRSPADVAEAFAAVERLSASHFDGGGVFLEKYLESARHIEVQVFGDGQGKLLALGERDCSAQRRNQKVIEETPAPGLSADTRAALHAAALRLLAPVRYASAGTVEFVLDAETECFYFLEVNTRLQVEHGVTEEVTGLDLVEWMVRQACGELELPEQAPPARGAAIEVRIYAEDPHKAFQPSTGTLTHVAFAPGTRTDAWVQSGTEITPFYDPLLAKVIARGATRDEALARLQSALDGTRLDGIETNLAYLRQLVRDEVFTSGQMTTRYLQRFAYAPRSIDVLDPGMQSTVQDYPGRVGLWPVGVPPSGPVDDLALRIANRLVGNPEDAPGLELALVGPRLRFNARCMIALCGADMTPTLDGEPVESWRALEVPAGSLLALGPVQGRGFRCYVALRGGLDVPRYLDSAATFMLGRFGGHGGRALRAGDVLHVAAESDALTGLAQLTAPAPRYPDKWEIAVLYGPHGAPDFFTPDDIATFFATDWEVHYNSDRTGIRLIGPKPEWARSDGGEAGLHPSNLHDNAYAIGTIDYTGDMPIILGPDGPSLGGFVCPATIVKAERWKMGQLAPGDRVRFVRVSGEQAAALLEAQRDQLTTVAPRSDALARVRSATNGAQRREEDAVLGSLDAGADRPQVVYRRAGDDYLLVEYGPLELDLGLRLRVHSLMQALQARRMRGILELTPGIRSLQLRYAPELCTAAELIELLRALELDLPATAELEVPTRIVHLPLSWEDPSTLLAIEKYMRVVRKDAPWCPSNIEFIRRINGLGSVDDVRQIVFDARYLVLGLGDVYLGAPVATPLDPRQRLVTTKYNPARTWTPENAVGIGGAYMCIYGMEGPGGYQFVGRTVQMWSTYGTRAPFSAERPWLLRFFDQIRFYPVSAEELLRMRADFPHGKLQLQIEEERFRYADYRAFLVREAGSIAAFRATQRDAFVAERERWRAAGQDIVASAAIEASPTIDPEASGEAPTAVPAGMTAVTSPVAGSLWKLTVERGQRVHAGDTVAVVEAMKTEIAVQAPLAGRVHALHAEIGAVVGSGQVLLIVDPS
ncbi:MAG TPA: urea carboxylase [Polyangiales bacterium]|nr:urea carboxylase [Polyangiales bacterium]